MGQLADRIAHLLLEHGLDPAARQGELQALSSLEARDQKAAQERFHELKRALLVERRAQLLAQLRGFPFVRDLPPIDVTGYDLKEVESDLRIATRALRQAREIASALDEEAVARASIRERALAPRMQLAPVSWDALAATVDVAEAMRRAARREARIEDRARDAARRAAKLAHAKVAVPDASHADDAALEQAERALAAAETLEGAHEAALAPLRDPAVRAWRRESMRALEKEATDALARADVGALEALRARSVSLREEAARDAGRATRARRAGERGPERERRRGDTIDGYG